MPYQRILTVQDISCVGQCSITVALPILSACGLEACILPSAVLSTHTGGFTGFTVHDLTDEFPKIIRHWRQEQIRFDAVYTGYLCSVRQIDYLEELLQTLLAPNGKVIVDPVMADHGRLYPGFDETYAAGMRRLCRRADVILPNLTEACLLAGKPYCESYTERDISNLLQALRELGPNCFLQDRSSPPRALLRHTAACIQPTLHDAVLPELFCARSSAAARLTRILKPSGHSLYFFK